MVSFLDKRDFYKMMLRGRLPIAEAEFIFGKNSKGILEFFYTPLGTAIRVCVDLGSLREVKMYDRNGGAFELQNVFCGENLIQINDGEFVGVSSRIQIEDVIGRNFLIKTENETIITRAKMIAKPKVDKCARLVYN